MIAPLGAEQVLGTLLVLELLGAFVFALSGAAAGVKYRLDLFGAQKALGYGLDPVMAALLGMLTAIGGGMMRDILVSDIPAVLHSDLYAVAALAGALVVVFGHVLNAPAAAAAAAGAAMCFGIRLIALWRGWRLPTAGEREKATGAAEQSRRPS